MEKAHNHTTSSATAGTGRKATPFFGKPGGRGFFRGGAGNPGGRAFFSKEPSGPSIQTKLTVGQPNDVYEKEADAMADKVVQRKPIFESKAAPPDDTVMRKCAHCEKEEKLQKKGDGDGGKGVSAGVESGLNASKGSGSALPDKTRERMESSFGADFSSVRIHDNSSAASMNKDLQAQAFTHGNDIYFNSGKYDPRSKSGQHLLAHELTHTIQQGGSNVVRRDGEGGDEPKEDSSLTEQLQVEKDNAAAGANQNEDLMLRASATRMALLLATAPPVLKSQDELDTFIEHCRTLSKTELDTLGAFSPGGAELVLGTSPKGFPLTWSGRIQAALTFGNDPATILTNWLSAIQDLQARSQTLPSDIMSNGLPVPAEQLSRLDGQFRLRMSNANAPQASGIRDYAQASIRYMQIKWVSVFAFTWEMMVNEIAGKVADGTLVPQYTDYKDFIDNKQAILRGLPDRARTYLSQDEADAQKMQSDALHLADASLFVGMTGGLYSLFAILSGWTEATGFFDNALQNADGQVAGESDGERIIDALKWAYTNGYFGAAAAAWVQNLIDNGADILKEMAVILILGMIPGVDILVAVYLAFTVARDFIGLIDATATAFQTVMNARTVSELQKASMQLATVLTNGAIQILIVLATEGIGRIAGKIRSRAGELMAKDAKLTRQEAEKKALEELSAEEKGALENGPAKIAKKFQEFQGACSLGSIFCRTNLPEQVVKEAGDYPATSGVPMPKGPFNIRKAILSDVERGTELLRDKVRNNPGKWPEFDKALAAAKKKGKNWPVDKDGKPWEVHHIKPVFAGGDSELENLVPLPKEVHQKYNNWWNSIHRAFKKRFSETEWDEIYWDEKNVPGSRVPKNPKR